ncbi:MAG: hypothetical protein SNH27_12525 [Rikenellaceae bacterium]
MKIFKKIKQWWQSRRLYVIADPTDNSITLSKHLFNHIKSGDSDVARVFMFRIGDKFGFMVNPDIEQPTQMCDIQYNEKYKCIGFETLSPSVGTILYDYDLEANKRVKLSISVLSCKDRTYYQIESPNAEYIR